MKLMGDAVEIVHALVFPVPAGWAWFGADPDWLDNPKSITESDFGTFRFGIEDSPAEAVAALVEVDEAVPADLDAWDSDGSGGWRWEAIPTDGGER